MNTDKKHIRNLAKICAIKGISKVVLSPGSRCAPLVIAFNRTEGIDCISVVDERSAAFYALGLAQQTLEPVALVCTSGSAALNYAPAIAEAYYQKIPLLILTADRPNEWIDQGENQSIQQFEMYKNYIKKSFQLPTQIAEEKDLWFSDRIVSEAINTTKFPDFGPVHINIPLREPLYNLVKDTDKPPKVIDFPRAKFSVDEHALIELKEAWNKAKKKLIVVGGQKKYFPKIEKALNSLAKDESVIVIKESISNVYGEDFIDTIDPLVEIINHQNLEAYTPDLILTFGGGVVSKKLKFWLRKQASPQHWHITKSFEHWDNFQSLSKVIQADADYLLETLAASGAKVVSNYKADWKALNEKIKTYSTKYLKDLPFLDFTVFDFIIKNLPENCNLHLGNSTPVRYANLLSIAPKNTFLINSNRGVSGIDGVSSTAAGASIAHPSQTTICITGDIAFMYDINALWNKNLKPNFKIILINNNGGNIFKIIPGPDKLEELEQFFETQQQIEVAPLAKMHGFNYYKAVDEKDLETIYKDFLTDKKAPALLEIFTNNELSAQGLRNYFNELRNKF